MLRTIFMSIEEGHRLVNRLTPSSSGLKKFPSQLPRVFPPPKPLVVIALDPLSNFTDVIYVKPFLPVRVRGYEAARVRKKLSRPGQGRGRMCVYIYIYISKLARFRYVRAL